MSLMLQKINFLGIFVFLLLALFIALAVSPERHDTYWHLAVGRQVWQEKAIPTNDKFTYGSPDTRYTSTEWLAGLIFFVFVKYLGPSGLTLLRLVIALTTLYFLYKTLKLAQDNDIGALFSTCTVGFVLSLRLNDRPEIFSFLFIALINYACFYYFLKRKISRLAYLLPPIFLLWPNIHAFTPIATAITVFWVALFLINRKVYEKRGFKIILAIIFLSNILAVIQIKRFFYPLVAYQKIIPNILEWSSAAERLIATKGFDFLNQIPIEFYFYFAYLALFGFLVIKVFTSKNNRLLMFIFLFYYALLFTSMLFYRLIPMTILATTPALFLGFSRIFSKQSKIYDSASKTVLCLMALTIAGSIFTKNIIGQRINVFIITNLEKGTVVQAVNRNWNQFLPIRAPQIIKDHLTSKRIFTQGTWNDYLIFGTPLTQTFSDIMF